MHIEEFRMRLQPHLDHFTQAKAQSYARYTGDQFLLSLFNYVHRLSAGSGKRIRPYVAYLVYRSAVDESDTSPQPPTSAMKLLSAFWFRWSCFIFSVWCTMT
jgi:geranylgeranyl pyrophosphate synthase